MAKIISVINLKGGVAKTTTTVQLAECLCSEFSKKVLVIDLDPQTNATIALISEEKWEELDDQKQTLFHLFSDKLEGTNNFELPKALQRGVSNLRLVTLSLLASSIKFIDIQDRISDISARSNYSINPMEVLKTAIHDELTNYDYVLIDCPPNLGFITRNGVEISDYYLIPTIPDTLSTYGIPQIVKTIHGFTQQRHLKIKCLGLVITKYASNSHAHARGMTSLPARFRKIFEELHIQPAQVFDTRMPQANATAEAMEYGNTPKTFKEKYGRSKSGDRYLYEYVIDLTKEFMKHVGS
jgi:chromosome partitioning protein